MKIRNVIILVMAAVVGLSGGVYAATALHEAKSDIVGRFAEFPTASANAVENTTVWVSNQDIFKPGITPKMFRQQYVNRLLAELELPPITDYDVEPSQFDQRAREVRKDLEQDFTEASVALAIEAMRTELVAKP